MVGRGIDSRFTVVRFTLIIFLLSLTLPHPTPPPLLHQELIDALCNKKDCGFYQGAVSSTKTALSGIHKAHKKDHF